jgi:hypothetical protein
MFRHEPTSENIKSEQAPGEPSRAEEESDSRRGRNFLHQHFNLINLHNFSEARTECEGRQTKRLRHANRNENESRKNVKTPLCSAVLCRGNMEMRSALSEIDK